jgi:hypothetical protein
MMGIARDAPEAAAVISFSRPGVKLWGSIARPGEIVLLWHFMHSCDCVCQSPWPATTDAAQVVGPFSAAA